MIARHRYSRIRNAIGIGLCIALGACALTSPAPEIAQASDANRITLNFADLELGAIIRLLAEFSDSNIVISDQIPNVGVTMSADNVPWDEVLEQLVHCVGGELGQDGNIIVIRPATSPVNANGCSDIVLSGQTI